MGASLFVLWFAVGICPDWWPWRWPRRWPPPPPPPPWWAVILGGVGGVIGGWLFSNTWGPGPDGVDAIYAAATSAGALVGSMVLQGLAGALMGGRGQAAG